MTPHLPLNPMTITPPRWTPEEELERLRDFDNYERQSTPERETRKRELEQQLKKR